MKSLKTRNKSPVHYKYTWQRCADQSYLFAEGCSRRGRLGSACPAPLQRNPRRAARRLACLRGPDPRACQQLQHHKRTLAAGQRTTRCQCRIDLPECSKLRTCPGSCKWISAGRSRNALGARMGPTYRNRAARLSYEGVSSSFYGFYFF